MIIILLVGLYSSCFMEFLLISFLITIGFSVVLTPFNWFLKISGVPHLTQNVASSGFVNPQ